MLLTVEVLTEGKDHWQQSSSQFGCGSMGKLCWHARLCTVRVRRMELGEELGARLDVELVVDHELCEQVWLVEGACRVAGAIHGSGTSAIPTAHHLLVQKLQMDSAQP